MKNQILYIGIAVLSVFVMLSCSKEKNICDEDKVCYTEGPDSLYVKLSLSDNPQKNTLKEVSFYKGYFDDGKLIDHFYTQEKEIYYLLPIDSRYTASAKYVDGKDTVLVIDGGKLGDGSYTNCEESCYDWNEELILNLTLEK